MDMVNSDYSMWDTVVQMSGPWKAESKECEATPTTWNLGLVARGGATLSANVEAKLRRLTAINYDHQN